MIKSLTSTIALFSEFSLRINNLLRERIETLCFGRAELTRDGVDLLQGMTPATQALPQLFAAGAMYSLPCYVGVLLPDGRAIKAPFALMLRFSDGAWVGNDYDDDEFIGFVPTHWQYAAPRK